MTQIGQRVLVLGGSGTIGRATVAALAARGHHVTCILREGSDAPVQASAVLRADVTDAGQLRGAISTSGAFDAIISTLASRTGAPTEAWAIDHEAHQVALVAAQETGVTHFVLLSAICVQKPLLEFQKAKLAFEASLAASGLRYSIVRPTAFFKSLSGQVQRVMQGKPFLAFGDGTRTACKPISDRDLATFIAECLTEPERWDKILPIGGPGPAITPADQATMLAELLDRPVPLRRVPPLLLDTIIGVTGALGTFSGKLAAKSDLARIGRYYATESMLLWDAEAGRYDAAATPETGSDTLKAHYAELIAGRVDADLGDHAVF
ncbi:MAG: NAD(P)H-binding protein [Rhodobacteraceae bacterium]|nr:NAD(P)H-binding protein [Paracoccaceae bacterium]